jgi:hypothetical protein
MAGGTADGARTPHPAFGHLPASEPRVSSAFGFASPRKGKWQLTAVYAILAPTKRAPLLPLREKVAEGRMRGPCPGASSLAPTSPLHRPATGHLRERTPHPPAPPAPSPARGEENTAVRLVRRLGRRMSGLNLASLRHRRRSGNALPTTAGATCWKGPAGFPADPFRFFRSPAEGWGHSPPAAGRPGRREDGTLLRHQRVKRESVPSRPRILLPSPPFGAGSPGRSGGSSLPPSPVRNAEEARRRIDGPLPNFRTREGVGACLPRR